MSKVIVLSEAELKELIQECLLPVLEKLDNLSVQDNKQEWLTEQQAREMLQVSKTTLWSYRSKGMIPYSKIGNKIYYRHDDITSFIKKNV